MAREARGKAGRRENCYTDRGPESGLLFAPCENQPIEYADKRYCNGDGVFIFSPQRTSVCNLLCVMT